jgi:hypothetical protein
MVSYFTIGRQVEKNRFIKMMSGLFFCVELDYYTLRRV